MFVGLIDANNLAYCDVCTTPDALCPERGERELEPKKDAGTVCDGCDFILNERGRWVDVGG